MIIPAELDLSVQRHAPFPESGSWVLSDAETDLPVDLTGATILMTIAAYEGGPALLSLSSSTASPNSRMEITNATAGQYRPVVTEADHEALIAASRADAVTLQSRLKLRYDIKIIPASGIAYIAQRGLYYVQTGVTP